MALSSFLPTCQVDTHCAASAPRRAESPPVPFGLDILARPSFASSVSHHKIDKTGLIFSQNQNGSKLHQYRDMQIWKKKKQQNFICTHKLAQNEQIVAHIAGNKYLGTAA